MISLQPPRTEVHVLRKQVEWLNNPAIVRFSEQRHIKHTIGSQFRYIESFIEHPDNILREIHHDGEMVGTISACVDRHNRVADVGILVAHGYWGKGIGYTAWSKLCDTLFDTDMRRIEAGCMACNAPMIKIMQKYGMKEEGRRMSHFMVEGTYSDLVLYGRFR